MALNSIERKILENVRRSIKAGNETYICNGIGKYRVRVDNLQELRDAKNRLYRYIERRLDGSGTLGQWVARKHKKFAIMNMELQRKARVAWITWMLGEEVKISQKDVRRLKEYFNVEQS